MCGRSARALIYAAALRDGVPAARLQTRASGAARFFSGAQPNLVTMSSPRLIFEEQCGYSGRVQRPQSRPSQWRNPHAKSQRQTLAPVHNDVSFFVNRGRELRGVGSRPSPNLILRKAAPHHSWTAENEPIVQACSVHNID